MMLALLLGAGTGSGIVALAYGLKPPRPDLAHSLAAIQSGPAPVISEGGLVRRLGQAMAAPLARTGLPGESIRRDLAVLERDVQRHLADKALATLTGLLLPLVMTAVMLVGGVSVPLTGAFAASLLLGAAGFFVPDLSVRSEAAQRRAEFRHALSAFLDLTVISLAGGTGVEGALADATAEGNGWAFTQIRGALRAAQIARKTPWEMLARLGQHLGVSELAELSASITLAGTEGARVRASLTAKAGSLRAHQLAAAETEAQSATERMSLPVVGLFTGFLIFIGYPAISGVITGI